MPGYFVEWNNTGINKNKDIQSEKDLCFAGDKSENYKISKVINSGGQKDIKLLCNMTQVSSIPVKPDMPELSEKEISGIPVQSNLSGGNNIYTDLCDILVLIKGEEISVKIIDVNDFGILYYLCNDPEEKLLITETQKVSCIKYHDGTKKTLTENEALKSRKKEAIPINGKKIDGFGIFSLFAGLFGVAIFTVYIGILALIAGIISFIKVIVKKDKFKGIGYAIAGIILALMCISMFMAYQ